MINIRFVIGFLFILVVLSSCKKPTVSADELSAYIQDPENGLRKVVVKDSVVLTLSYEPKDRYIAEDSGKTDLSLDRFVFSVAQKNGWGIEGIAENREEQQRISNYLSKEMSRHLSMRMDSRIIPVEKFNYVAADNSKAGWLFIEFRSNLTERRSNFSIVYDDALFGTRQTEFIFHTKDLFEAPHLDPDANELTNYQIN